MSKYNLRDGFTREELLTKLLDELISIFCLLEGRMDFSCVWDALREIAITEQKYKGQFPVNLALYTYMEGNGLIGRGNRITVNDIGVGQLVKVRIPLRCQDEHVLYNWQPFHDQEGIVTEVYTDCDPLRFIVYVKGRYLRCDRDWLYPIEQKAH